MGSIISRVLDRISHYFESQEIRILILGLDNAGKTSILYKLQLNEIVETIPTIGFNVESVQYKNIKFQVWDLGGQTSIRPFWRCYYPNTNAIIFVVDSSDRERISDAKQELHLMLEEEELKNTILLILANKQDLSEALKVSEISQLLDLSAITMHPWTIVQCSAVQGVGILEGLDWLIDTLKNR